MGNFSKFSMLLMGIKFIVKPVMAAKESNIQRTKKQAIIQSLICGIPIGLICGFIGAGGGMMMLLILSTVLGYELKTAVGTSVFIMTFTALTGAISHFAIDDGITDYSILILCVAFTLIAARITAKFANKTTPKVMNRALGFGLLIMGVGMLMFDYLT